MVEVCNLDPMHLKHINKQMKAQGIKTLKLGKNSVKKEKEILSKSGDVINNALEKAVNENTGG